MLNPSLLSKKLVDQARKLTPEWPKHFKDVELSKLTFRSVDKKAIQFVNEHRPLRRILYFQASQAKRLAIEKGWVSPDWDFEKFGSEGKMQHIETWLVKMCSLPPKPDDGPDSGDEDDT